MKTSLDHNCCDTFSPIELLKTRHALTTQIDAVLQCFAICSTLHAHLRGRDQSRD